MPEGCAYVGRPTKWGNPFTKSRTVTARRAVQMYRQMIEMHMGMCVDIEKELRGKDLCCWCPIEAEYCHADVLLEIANKEDAE